MRNKSTGKRYIFTISVILNIVFIMFLISKRFYYHQISINSSKTPLNDSLITYTINKYKYNQTETDFFKILPHAKTDIVFLGTSLTQGFPLQEIFDDCRLKNRGIGGNTLTDISSRLYEVTDGRPAKLFLEMGTNDIGNNIPLNKMLELFKSIINTVKAKTPSTRIYVQSVLPFGTNKIDKIKLYNKTIQDYCSKNKITYINLFPYFLQNGGIKQDLTTDGTHLNGKGYFLWAEKVQDYLLD
jgi:hypothetical protein